MSDKYVSDLEAKAWAVIKASTVERDRGRFVYMTDEMLDALLDLEGVMRMNGRESPDEALRPICPGCGKRPNEIGSCCYPEPCWEAHKGAPLKVLKDEKCPTCGEVGPDKFWTDDEGHVEADCGNEYHDQFFGRDTEVSE